ncbi:MAG: class I SAM-dependent methyltransferase [Gammaproteobacteria bacterium]|nr:class I SAM-dependent methyltransferase [Gammaproteobacteria bacterium]MDH5305321.1 class I SAM-dependent methyltransferase [Gammaproteobacteria bacterium]MDH5323287.1 class I SAM-dependent methyltransferase [Gammaproteobacteria bacterium]
MEYQSNYTENPVAKRNMYDEHAREAKAHKIVAVLEHACGNLSSLSILDVSCSTGIIPRFFSRHFHKVVGIDIDEGAVAFAQTSHSGTNLEFHVMDALHTRFQDASFDVVVCNQMYEHVPDAQQLLAEIRRVLVPGGVCYFGATNRLKVIETHYGRIPFLSYLPKPLAHRYLQVLGRGRHYYENLHTYWTLKKLCSNFEVSDYTVEVIRDPERFFASDMVAAGSAQQRLALAVLKLAYWLSPGYIWILRKPKLSQDGLADTGDNSAHIVSG